MPSPSPAEPLRRSPPDGCTRTDDTCTGDIRSGGTRASCPGCGPGLVDEALKAARRHDAGMVTAELAVAIPAVVLVLAVCLAGLGAMVDQVRCVDAARLGARAAARGDPPAGVRALAERAAPEGARVSIGSSQAEVRVVVTATTGGWVGFVPSWNLVATATTPVEPGGR